MFSCSICLSHLHVFFFNGSGWYQKQDEKMHVVAMRIWGIRPLTFPSSQTSQPTTQHCTTMSRFVLDCTKRLTVQWVITVQKYSSNWVLFVCVWLVPCILATSCWTSAQASWSSRTMPRQAATSLRSASPTASGPTLSPRLPSMWGSSGTRPSTTRGPCASQVQSLADYYIIFIYHYDWFYYHYQACDWNLQSFARQSSVKAPCVRFRNPLSLRARFSRLELVP